MVLQTRRNVRIVFDALCANPKVTVQRLDGLLSAIPRWDGTKIFFIVIAFYFIVIIF
jgi:hypothetical protein